MRYFKFLKTLLSGARLAHSIRIDIILFGKNRILQFGVRAPNYRTPPLRARSHFMHDFPKFNPLHSKMDCIPNNDRIQLAIADLESQERLNYANTAKK
jgi:hypothetical protein